MRRSSEVAALSKLVRETESGLSVAAVIGPGGVGKSYLLDEVFRREKPFELGFMHLTVDASNPQTRSDFFGLVDGQLAARSLPPPARPDYDYFPQLRSVASLYRDMVEKARDELGRSNAPGAVRTAALALLRTAHVLNDAIPKTRRILDVAKLGIDEETASVALDAAWDLVTKLGVLRHSTSLPGPLRDLFGLTKQNRVKRDLFNFTADALCGDITASLLGYRKKDMLKLTHARLDGLSRLLIVFDDFEATAPVLGDFLVSALLPRLAAARFPTLVLIACRDDLEATHVGFGQHAKRWIKEQIVLRPFNRDDADALMTEAQIPAEKHQRLFGATHGFPFLLALAIEEATAPDSESALLAKKFFDRTTRWMTERELGWFVALCYLDVVNEDTIRSVLGESEDPGLVQRWFEHEASIRDPAAKDFTIRPLIREKSLRYLAARAPSRHRAMLDRAASAQTPPATSVPAPPA
jgi:hypothetical protein